MMRKVLSIAMALLTILCVNAQMPQPTPLPLNPKVKSGKLPNGLEYFILHNEEPKNRANFYIAQKVGSTLETQDQLGLAHFLEHMAFNGTKNFPGKAMLNYLQDKGIRFGYDINAYTGFDETVYNINNVPTTDKNLMDSCLLALHDWSCALELLDSEIDAERGVIQSEAIQTTDAMRRMMAAIAPQVFDEYQYHQMPIGSMEVIKNFPYQALRDYYHKWYRPDQQGIVVVGDFDADEMEKKVISLFSTIPMPENAAERTYAMVSKNAEPIYAFYSETEFPQPIVYISYKEDKTPRELRSTVEGYIYGPLMENLITSMINHRLSDYTVNPECAYSFTGTRFGNLWFAKTIDAFNITIAPKGDEMLKATDQAMAIISRACKTGFTESELDRVRDELMSTMERSYNERDKTDSDVLGNEIIRYYVDGDATPGIEVEYELLKQVLPTLPVELINQFAATILTPDNQVIVVAQPDKEGMTVVAKEDMIASVNNAMNADYEPYVDEVITEPLIASLPAPGKVTKVEEDAKLGTNVITLSNGVKVVVKTTDFSNDEIRFEAFKEGGKRSYPVAQAANINMISDAFECSKMGPFNQKTLKKYLAGKNVGIGYEMGNYTNILKGASSVKDLQTLMELIYTSFTALGNDKEYYDVVLSGVIPNIDMMEKNPEVVFKRRCDIAEYNGNPMMDEYNFSYNIKESDYDTMLSLLKESMANAADYTFMFVGNVDVATITPMLEQYIATLPAGPVNKVKTLTDLTPVKGKVTDNSNFQSEVARVFVKDVWSGYNLEYNVSNNINISILGQILGMVYLETLREEEGGTYSPSAYASMNPNMGIWQIVGSYTTNKDQLNTLLARSQKELENLLNNGAEKEKFERVKGAMLNQYEQAIKSNGYWLGAIFMNERGFDNVTGYAETLKNLDLAGFNAWMKNLYDGKNEIEVIMNVDPVN